MNILKLMPTAKSDFCFEKTLLICILFLSVLIYLFASVSKAQDHSFGVASSVSINKKDIKNGSIISSSAKGFVLSAKEYDPSVIGVVALNPALLISDNSGEANIYKYPVVNSGKTLVLVSAVNGPISVGDFITSSRMPGIGMKATKSGFIIGTSLEKFTSTDAIEIKPLQINLSLRYSAPRASLSRNLFDVVNLSGLAWTEEPLTVFRYLLAAVVIILSLILGFYAFGRTAGKGVEALGRNPLAARVIQLGIALNVVITVAIIGAGILIAILILTI